MPDLLSVAVTQHADRTIIAPSGELDLSTVSMLEEALDSSLDRRLRVEIELAELTFIDSTGLRLLIKANEAARAASVDLLLSHPSPPVMRIFDLAGLTKRLSIMAAEPAARATARKVSTAESRPIARAVASSEEQIAAGAS